MGRCLNIETIIEKGTADETFNNTGEENLKILLDTAKYSEDESNSVLEEYAIFKKRIHDLNKSDK